MSCVNLESPVCMILIEMCDYNHVHSIFNKFKGIKTAILYCHAFLPFLLIVGVQVVNNWQGIERL